MTNSFCIIIYAFSNIILNDVNSGNLLNIFYEFFGDADGIRTHDYHRERVVTYPLVYNAI